MTFFRDDEGHLHLLRIAAVLYTVGLITGCGSDVFAPLFLARAVFVAGWWIAYGEKRPFPRTLSELAHHPHRVIGITLIISSLIAQGYLEGPHPTKMGLLLLVLLVGIASFCAGGLLYREYRK
jgi:hypothetical protein